MHVIQHKLALPLSTKRNNTLHSHLFILSHNCRFGKSMPPFSVRMLVVEPIYFYLASKLRYILMLWNRNAHIAVFGVCTGLSFRVFVQHHSLQLLPVPGHLVCKRYEIFSLRVTQNDVWKTERRRNEDKEAECEIKCRAVNVMYRHRHTSLTVLFSSPSSKE